jgi:hypothetical protein
LFLPQTVYSVVSALQFAVLQFPSMDFGFKSIFVSVYQVFISCNMIEGLHSDLSVNVQTMKQKLLVTLVTEESLSLAGSRTSDLRELSKFRDFSENRSVLFACTNTSIET